MILPATPDIKVIKKRTTPRYSCIKVPTMPRSRAKTRVPTRWTKNCNADFSGFTKLFISTL